jgi:hypothetical protein
MAVSHQATLSVSNLSIWIIRSITSVSVMALSLTSNTYNV